jgi:hypothetical protein
MKSPLFLSSLSNFVAVWKELKAPVIIESHRTVGNQTTPEHRLYISST